MSEELECKKCGNEWTYNGRSEYYATCPNCKISVKIQGDKEEIGDECG